MRPASPVQLSAAPTMMCLFAQLLFLVQSQFLMQSIIVLEGD
jgi:hypothetical protein